MGRYVVASAQVQTWGRWQTGKADMRRRVVSPTGRGVCGVGAVPCV